MSRLGKLAVAIPDGVTVTVDGQTVTAKGPKGELSVALVDAVTVAQTDEGLAIKPVDDSRQARSAWGMSRTLVYNVVAGVSAGFERRLAITGVGYRALMEGNELKLALGYSHDIFFKPPEGVEIETPAATEIIVRGADKQQVGQVAANIREFRPPEPYKGKGVRFVDEYVHRKEGKKK